MRELPAHRSAPDLERAGEAYPFGRQLDMWLTALEVARRPLEMPSPLSEASFSHAFRQWGGVAPGAYRRQVRPEDR